jgi:GNAT superfamily N-acetyltransferase
MWWRLKRPDFEQKKGDGNRKALRKIVNSGDPTGVIAYSGSDPVGWCALAPRENYSRLERSRILQPVDDQAVWSVTCFYVARGWRKTGLTAELLGAAAKYARKNGARIVEGYPVDPRQQDYPDTFAYHGLVSAFRKAGFKEVARRSASRPVMRLEVGSK